MSVAEDEDRQPEAGADGDERRRAAAATVQTAGGAGAVGVATASAAGSLIGRLRSLRAGRGVGHDAGQGRLRERRPEPGRGPREPVVEGDRGPVAEDPGGLVDAAHVAPDVAGPGRPVDDLERPPDGPPDRLGAGSSIVVSTPVPTWNSSPATRSSGASSAAAMAAARSSTWTKSRVWLPVAVDRDRLARERRPQPGRDDALLVERVRAVGVREAQGAGGDPVRRGIGPDVRLAGELRGTVRRDRAGQDGLVGRRLVVARGRVGGGEDEPPDPRLPGRLEEADRPGDVGLERAERVADRVGDAGPGRQVDDRVDAGRRPPRRPPGRRATRDAGRAGVPSR